MIEACFYYNVPVFDKKRNFFDRFLINERSHIENINSLVSKLAKAKEELKDDLRWNIHCAEYSFPVFFFNIETKGSLGRCCEKLFSVTDPFLPYQVSSCKIGYNIIKNVLEQKYSGFLKSVMLPLFDKDKRIIIPKNQGLVHLTS